MPIRDIWCACWERGCRQYAHRFYGVPTSRTAREAASVSHAGLLWSPFAEFPLYLHRNSLDPTGTARVRPAARSQRGFSPPRSLSRHDHCRSDMRQMPGPLRPRTATKGGWCTGVGGPHGSRAAEAGLPPAGVPGHLTPRASAGLEIPGQVPCARSRTAQRPAAPRARRASAVWSSASSRAASAT